MTHSRIKPLAPVRIGGSDVWYAPGVRAGDWVFLTGHEATDHASGLAPEVLANPRLPNHGLPFHRREGDYILARIEALLAGEGTGLSHAVRLDQYYPSWRPVDPYHHARKARFKAGIPPSTSVLMKELLYGGAGIDTSLIAVIPGKGLDPRRADPKDVPVPVHSGFAPSLIAGDYVFVAGQIANAEDMEGLHPAAHRPRKALWHGTDIRLQTAVLIDRLSAGLEAGGSSLDLAVKAQVYLGDIADTADFLDVWNARFGANPCALTIVPTAGFGQTDCIIEINIFGVRRDGRVKKEIVDAAVPRGAHFGPAAVRAGDLVCLSGLMAADDHGARYPSSGALKHLGAGARRQMEMLLDLAGAIATAAGTSLENVVRAHHFHTDLGEFYPAHRAWQTLLPGQPIPFGAIGVPAPMPVPDTSLLLDLWLYAPR